LGPEHEALGVAHPVGQAGQRGPVGPRDPVVGPGVLQAIREVEQPALDLALAPEPLDRARRFVELQQQVAGSLDLVALLVEELDVGLDAQLVGDRVGVEARQRVDLNALGQERLARRWIGRIGREASLGAHARRGAQRRSDESAGEDTSQAGGHHAESTGEGRA